MASGFAGGATNGPCWQPQGRARPSGSSAARVRLAGIHRQPPRCEPGRSLGAAAPASIVKCVIGADRTARRLGNPSAVPAHSMPDNSAHDVAAAARFDNKKFTYDVV